VWEESGDQVMKEKKKKGSGNRVSTKKKKKKPKRTNVIGCWRAKRRGEKSGTTFFHNAIVERGKRKKRETGHPRTHVS